MGKIRVLLVDDHRIFRDGVISLFDDEKEIEIVDVASNGKEALEKLKFIKADVILLDLSLNGISGIEVLKIINENYSDNNVLILSMHTEEEFVFKAISSGAKGYLPKENTNKQELMNAIRLVSRGEEYYSDSIEKIMQKYFLNKAKHFNDENNVDYNLLTKREKEILKLIVEGLSNSEIADKLFVNIRTVETHKTNIIKKLKLKNVIELVKYAIKNNLVEI